ncbi:hypothetical protein B0I35DRAFT_229658 [Stachybotrys elegans]|uniref:Uncharacterized protein n=1 Tax=Stachybotrys elegans TaxID=80388 RepID=A0A8K0ST44_9HYPO|nr:hypothetical protein B0I35DRAFT_229658 [Stachybotrys elegans]
MRALLFSSILRHTCLHKGTCLLEVGRGSRQLYANGRTLNEVLNNVQREKKNIFPFDAINKSLIHGPREMTLQSRAWSMCVISMYFPIINILVPSFHSTTRAGLPRTPSATVPSFNHPPH